MNSSFSILHISDLHIGELTKKKSFRHGLRLNNGESEIVGLIAKALGGHRPTFMVVSGDLTCEGGHEDEHRDAVRTIHALCRATSIGDRRRVFIVAGNHDIERGAPLGQRLSKHNDLFMKVFYGGAPWPDETGHGLPLEDYVPASDFGDNRDTTKARWIFPFEDQGVLFIPLYSADSSVDIHLPQWIKKALKTTADPWAFDRGLVSQEQLDAVDADLKQMGSTERSLLRVAIFHHNPLPIVRSGIRIDDHYMAESNLLANGAEVIEKLREWGVALVLHGHRHQNSVLAPRSSTLPLGAAGGFATSGTLHSNLVILGAPSIGLSLKELDQLTDGPSRPPFDFIGFNLIEVHHSKYGIRGTLHRFRGKPGPGLAFHSEDIGLTFSYLDAHAITLLTAADGLQELGRQILHSQGGVTILHYHPTATWEDKVADDPPAAGRPSNPFTRLWGPVLEGSDILDHLAELAIPGMPLGDWKARIHSVLKECLDKGYHLPELLKVLRDVRRPILNTLKNDDVDGQANSFLRHVESMCREDTRRGNYSLELLRMACDPSFVVKKCVYFWPPHRTTGGGQGPDSNWLIKKFGWMIETASVCRSLDNFHLAWLPFSVAGYYGQSVVSIALEPKGAETTPTSILVGYAELDLATHEDLSVLYLRGEYEPHLAAGVLGRDLRALMRKIIYPLTARLLRDFPVFRDQTLYMGNLDLLAQIYGVSNAIPTDLGDRFEQSGTPLQREPTIDLKRLDNLFRWVLPVSDAVGGQAPIAGNAKLEIPWDEEDYQFLKMRLTTSHP